MERDDVLNVRIPANLKAGLRRAAADDLRTMSSMVEVILTQWLTAKGYVSAKRAPKKREG